MIWVAFALLTGVVVFSVLVPLARAPRSVAARDADIAFYKAQIDEIARDAERGLIAPQDAPVANAEAARRLLAANERAGGAAKASRLNIRVAALIAIIVIPVVTLGLYLRIGNPALPDDPLQARLDADPAHLDIMAAIAKIEAHLAQDPDDAKAYALVAPIYMQLGRAGDAVHAYANIIRLTGATADDETAFGEAQFYAAGGSMTPDATEAFTKAAAIDPKDVKAQFYLVMAADQAGDDARALALSTALLADAPQGAPWADAVRNHIAELEKKLGASAAAATVPPAATPAPDASKAAAIAALSPADRDRAIRGMVAGLAARLGQGGGTVDDWSQLVNDYAVLHDMDKARAALASARTKLAGDAPAMAKLQQLAQKLGLEG